MLKIKFLLYTCILMLNMILFASDVKADAGLTLSQDKLGNIFLTTEVVKIPVRSNGTSIEWVVYDFWDNTIVSGVNQVVTGTAVIQPDLNGSIGYFLICLTAKNNEVLIGTAQTSFAVVYDNSNVDKDDSPFGVMTHFSQSWNTDIMPLITKAGIMRIRDENYWSSVEREKGVYDFSKYQEYMDKAEESGLDVLMPMTFGNTLYDSYNNSSNTAPYTDTGREAYANYGKAMIDNYRQLNALEVWNEYNGNWCDGPASNDRPLYYTEMLKKTYNEIKNKDSSKTVIGGAAVMVPAGYYEKLFEKGALNYMDALCIHPYSAYSLQYPEVLQWELRTLNERMKTYNGGTAKPIWATECGSFDSDRKVVARYLARINSLMYGEGVEKMYWYLMKDHSNFTGMGLLYSENSPMGKYAPAPAYAAYSNLIHQLYDAVPLGEESIGATSNAYIYKFIKDNTEIRSCWSTNPDEDVYFQTSEPLKIVDIMGNSVTHYPVNNEVFVDLGDEVVYVIGKVDGIIPASPMPVANSLKSFYGAQGHDNWEYKYTYNGNLRDTTWSATSWNWAWQTGIQYLDITATGGTIPTDSPMRSPVRRWVSDIDGKIDVSGIVGCDDIQSYHTMKILVNGNEVYSIDADGGVKNYQTPSFSVKKGDYVDFVTKNTVEKKNANGRFVFTANIFNSDRIVTTFDITDRTGNPIYNLNRDVLKAKANIKNYTGKAQPFVLVAALYGSNQELKNITYKQGTIPSTLQDFCVTVEMPLTNEALSYGAKQGDSVKLMLWNSFDDMVNITKVRGIR